MGGRDWTGTCEHGFTGLPEDCFKCERESVKQAIAAAERRGREAMRAKAASYIDELGFPGLADGIRALLPSQEAATGGEAPKSCARPGCEINFLHSHCACSCHQAGLSNGHCTACAARETVAPPAVQRPVTACSGPDHVFAEDGVYCDCGAVHHTERP
jgi:hypothetical protein